MGYVGIYLPAEISKTETKQIFADISPTNINITQSSRYPANTWWLSTFDSRKRVEVKLV